MMKRTTIIIGILLFLPSFVLAESIAKRWGVGLNYPGLSVKYGINEKNALELKSQFGEGIFVIGPRYYYNFNPKDKAVIFLGGEVAYISFKGDESEGSGFCVGGFVGGEYFVNKNFAVSMDIGPVYITLKDKDTSLDESGVDFVLNLGLNYYFGGGQR
jgi:hypothetical protein